MGKKAPKTPAAPDPAVTAAAQTATNKESAWYNAMLENMNQETPYGNLTYEQTGTVDAPKWTSRINLSPEQQSLYDTSMRSENALAGLGEAQLGRISDSVSTPFSFAGLGDAPTAQSIEQLSQQGQDAIMARLNPQFAQDEEAIRSRLINQGIGQGSQAYQREMDTFNQKVNDARNQAILQGANYGGTLQNQALTRRNQGIQEYTTQRNAPLNEYTAMTSGSQVQNPTFSSGGNSGTQPVDYANLVNQNYQAQVGQANARAAANNATTSGLFGLGGSLLGAAGSAGGFGSLFAGLSDKNAKQDIKHIGEENGYPIYEFAYKIEPNKRYIGVMAQDVQKIKPEAVVETDEGLKVYYDMIGVKMREVA